MDLSNYTNTEVEHSVDTVLLSDKPAESDGVLRNTQLSALELLASLLLKEIEFLKQSEDRTRHLLETDRGIDLHEEVQNFEKGLIRSALIHAKGVQKNAAVLLGVKVTTLNVKIKRYKISFETSESTA